MFMFAMAQVWRVFLTVEFERREGLAGAGSSFPEELNGT